MKEGFLMMAIIILFLLLGFLWLQAARGIYYETEPFGTEFEVMAYIALVFIPIGLLLLLASYIQHYWKRFKNKKNEKD